MTVLEESQGVEGWSKKEKGLWAWTTVWQLLGGRDIKGTNGNGKNMIQNRLLMGEWDIRKISQDLCSIS